MYPSWCGLRYLCYCIDGNYVILLMFYYFLMQEPHIRVRGKFGEELLCVKDLLFKTKNCRDSEQLKCQWRFINGNKIKPEDEHLYKCSDKNTLKCDLSISSFEDNFVGEYECVISTEESTEITAKTAVQVSVYYGEYAWHGMHL